MNRIAAAGKPYGITVTKIRRALGDGRLASSFNLLLPEAVATGNLTIVPNAVVREVTVDKNTGLVNGALSSIAIHTANSTRRPAR